MKQKSQRLTVSKELQNGTNHSNSLFRVVKLMYWVGIICGKMTTKKWPQIQKNKKQNLKWEPRFGVASLLIKVVG